MNYSQKNVDFFSNVNVHELVQKFRFTVTIQKDGTLVNHVASVEAA